MRGISSRLHLRPAIGFVAALPFIMPTPVIAGSFLQTLGSSGVEPLLYVLILWMLRSRPFAFGALLAFGFLHREFTMYALPALALVELADGSAWTGGHRQAGAQGRRGFARRLADHRPRRKCILSGSSLILQAQQLGSFACLDRGPRLPSGFDSCSTRNWPVLSGGTDDAARPLRDAQFRGRRFSRRRMDCGRDDAGDAGEARLAVEADAPWILHRLCCLPRAGRVLPLSRATG